MPKRPALRDCGAGSGQRPALPRYVRADGTALMAREAIAHFVDYDDWFIREVEKGMEQIERGQVLTHHEVGARRRRP